MNTQLNAQALLAHLQEKRIFREASDSSGSREESYETRVCLADECFGHDNPGHDAHNHALLSDCIHEANKNVSLDCAYDWTLDLLQLVAGAEPLDVNGDKLDETLREWADAVSVSTSDQTAWLAEDVKHASYLRQIIVDFGSDGADFALAAAQSAARMDVAACVTGAIREARPMNA